ncbi:MAG: hypothetical protein AB7O49_17610 [Sphingomonadales bacterium]
MTDLIGLEKCTEELATLVAKTNKDIEQAKGRGDEALDAAIDQASARFRGFIKRSKPADPDEADAIKRLDELALEAAFALHASAIDDAVARIKEIAATLKTLGEDVGKLAKANQATAKKLGLSDVVKAVESMTTLVETVKQAKKELKADPAEADIAAKIETLLTAFNQLRTTLPQR